MDKTEWFSKLIKELWDIHQDLSFGELLDKIIHNSNLKNKNLSEITDEEFKNALAITLIDTLK